MVMRLIDEQRVSWFDLRRFLPGPWQIEDELQDDEWEREIEPESTTSPVYEAAPALRWTTNPPNTAGLYFVRIPPNGVARVVDVYRVGRDKWWCEWSDLAAREVIGCGLEFSDQPIREPVS